MHFDYIACSYIAKLNVEMTEPFTKLPIQIAIVNIFKRLRCISFHKASKTNCFCQYLQKDLDVF